MTGPLAFIAYFVGLGISIVLFRWYDARARDTHPKDGDAKQGSARE